MNTTQFKSFKEEESDVYSDFDIQKLLRDGWVLLAIRTRRKVKKEDGSFEEIAIYSLAHESEKP